MATIVRGTTPTITYTFDNVEVANITTALLTFKQDGSIVLQKALSDATVGEDSLSWTLTQAETLELGETEMMLNWVTTDGTRGVSRRTPIKFASNHIEEVI